MPIPKLNEGEDEKSFISRCVSAISDEYDQEQAVAICYSQLKEKMSKMKQEELFVLQPRKAENRGTYLTRCSKHNKMRTQYPNLKERMGFCLSSFNEYYKYWAKMSEDMAEVPKDTTLGDCIAREKAKGFNYKEAYAHCATKVGTPPLGAGGSIVLTQDDANLLVEPVMFGGPISIDFDDTLSTEKGMTLAKKMIDEGEDLHIVTRRNKSDSGEVYKVADELGIDKNKVHFTGGEMKWKTIKDLGVVKHIDNNQKEIDAIKENLPYVQAIKF